MTEPTLPVSASAVHLLTRVSSVQATNVEPDASWLERK
jgi:hypothetical protein